VEIRKVACVGSGLIGHGWATLFAWKGYKVSLHDLSEKTLKDALCRISRNLEFLSQEGKFENRAHEESLRKIEVTTSLEEALADADYIQESVFESYPIKKEVFKEMDAVAREDSILASSTSTLKMTNIQKAVKRPGRCIVAHPWNPPYLMPLVEIIPGRKTSTETVKATKGLMSDLGKIVVVQKKEVSGTIGNRLSAALWREAIDLVDKGVAELDDVDKAVSAGPGIRWAILGPHLTYHLAGGRGGIEYYIRHLGPAMAARWRTLATWTSLSPSAERKIVKDVKKAELIQQKSLDEIIKWRDEKLVKLLETLYG